MSKLKYLVSAVFVGLCSYVGAAFATSILTLLCLNVFDYITRLLANFYTGKKIKSDLGIKGIFKKGAMWLLIVIGFMIDKVIVQACASANFTLSFQFTFASIVSLWLIFNEIISVLENLSEIGLNVPFLMPFAKYVRDKINKSAEIKEDNKNEN